MAEAEIAFVASAGAAGLALSLSVWAWRLRRRLMVREQSLRRSVDTDAGAVALRDDALAGFGDIRLDLSRPDGDVRIFGDAAVVDAARQALVQHEDDAGLADPGRALIAAVRRANPKALTHLIEAGEACDLSLPGREGRWSVQGRLVGGMAWLRLAPSAANGPEAGSGLERLADLSPMPTWVTDAQGSLIWANRAWLDQVGVVDLEAARKTGARFDRGVDTLLAEAHRTGAHQDGFRWTTGSDRRMAWRILAEPLAGEQAVLAFAIDMTEAEETRDTLRRHVSAHDETLNHLADAVAIFGPSKRLAFHNTAFQSLFNIDPAWLDDRPTHAELLDRLRQKRELPEVVDYSQWKARELGFYEATQASPDDSWSLPDGRTLRVVRQPHPLGGILLLFSDITNELQLRSQYNAQIQVQKATLDKLNDAVAVFGSDGRLRLHNEAFETFWTLSQDAIVEAGDFDAIAGLAKAIMPDPALWLGLKARVADPDPESRIAVAGEGRTSDGRVAAWQTRPLPDGATLVAFSDVTARRDLEQALAAKAAALEESQLLKREFVGSVSYELRTPLTTIVGYSELLETMSDLPERSRQHAGAIRISASQLARSIDDVLDMAQIDAGEMELNLSDVHLGDILQRSDRQFRDRVEGRGAKLVIQDGDATTLDALLSIRGDERRLAQAIDHLMDNATRAVGQDGEVRLSVEPGHNEVRVRVTDTGRGIPYHQQAHVFDRFVRRERGGPGVGLALVKAMVELHGGWAEVESEPGKGAAFTLHLPLSASTDAAMPELGLEAT